MSLTEAQKKQLSKLSVQKLLDYMDKGTISFPEDFTYVDDVKKEQVQNEVAQRPNPQEVREWKIIEDKWDDNSETLRYLLESYIMKWESFMPSQNHVADAKNKIADMDALERDALKAKELKEWDEVDQFDIHSLYGYLAKYPKSIHISEIDDAVWSIIQNQGYRVMEVNEYMRKFSTGRHLSEASRVLNEYTTWQNVKNSREILGVFNYIEDNEDSPFLNEAKILLLELKDEEIEKMRRMASNYSADTLLSFLDNGIFSENELISKDVVTTDSLQILLNLQQVKDGLPDINDEINKCRKECAPDRTDVFLFGIPSTGKSCILMGLIGSSDIDVSYAKAGGPYAGALRQCLEAGFTIGQTPKDFVATLEAEIENGSQTHKINLVEMAGEDFAFKLAQNPDGQISFKDMGEGAPELLGNDNRKAFFLIVDPTARVVTFNRIVTTYDSEGNAIQKVVRSNVNQLITLKRMVDLFALDENASIMQKVDSIHIIITKADMCGNDVERDEKAYDLFMSKYKSILRPLAKLCEKYGINVSTNGFPKLYTFSLGNFYVGGIYQYDETDANKLVNVIKGSVWGEKKPSIFDRLRDIVNKPIV